MFNTKPTSDHDHAAAGFASEELLLALVAERLDRLADRMIARSHDKLAIFGRLEHTDWLHTHIQDLDSFPIVAYITPDSLHPHADSHRTKPILPIDSPRLNQTIDTILISDDRYEEALAAQALRWTPPGTIIYRLYERLPIGREALLHSHHPHHPHRQAPPIQTRRIAPSSSSLVAD